LGWWREEHRYERKSTANAYRSTEDAYRSPQNTYKYGNERNKEQRVEIRCTEFSSASEWRSTKDAC
jgi:hypothetical protein